MDKRSFFRNIFRKIFLLKQEAVDVIEAARQTVENFLRKKNTYANAGISTRFLTVSPAAMISLP